MDERKEPGTWVEPRFDADQTEHPPAPAGSQGGGGVDGTDAAHPRTDGTSLAPTGPLMAPDPRTVRVDLEGESPVSGDHASGVTHDLPREYEGDPTRPD